MSKPLYSLLIIAISLLSTNTYAQGVSTKTSIRSNHPTDQFSGSWKSENGKEFSIMNDGFFTVVGEDSTGAWKDMHAGTYTIDDSKTATFKILYSSYPDHMNSLHTVEYEISGNKITLHFFKKLIDAKEGDITAKMPKDVKTVFVRATR